MDFPLIEGFDLYNGTGGNFGLTSTWRNDSSGGGISLVAGRYGGQALNMTDGQGSNSHIRRFGWANNSAFSIGFAFRQNHFGNQGNQNFFRLEDSFNTQLSLYLDAGTGTLRLYRGLGSAILIASPVNAMQNATWGYIECFGNLDQAAGHVELWLNGVQLGVFDGDTAGHSSVVYNGCLLQAMDGSGSGNQSQFDDLFIGNAAQRVGECRIETLRPMADTAQKQFVPSTAGSNFDDVDDATFNSADYVDGLNVNDMDLYEIVDLSTTPAAIHAVQANVLAWRTDAGSRKLATVIDSGGTQVQSSDLLLIPDSKIYEGPSRDVNPNGGAAWTPAAVNALKLGMKVTA